MEFKTFSFFAALLIFLIPACSAAVSHNSDQIYVPGGGTLAQALSGFTSGSQICTNSNSGDGNCVDNAGISSCTFSGCTSNPAWGQLSGMPTFASDIINNRAKMVHLGCGGSWASSCDADSSGWIDYADSTPWAGINGKPAFASNAVNERVRAVDTGCGGSWASSCDANVNGWPDGADYANSAASATTASNANYANSAPWAGISNRPPINAYGSGVQALVYYDDDPNYYIDINTAARIGGYIETPYIRDLNDVNYYVDPNGASRFYSDIRITNGRLYAQSFTDQDDPSMRYVDPSGHTQIGTLTAYGNIYAFTGLTANDQITLRGNSGAWGLRLFVWENSGCDYAGVSLGCEGSPPRCLCIRKTA